MSQMDEPQRIVAEVARRASRIPSSYYALDRPANRYLYTRYTRAARALLDGTGHQPPAATVLEVGCGDAQWLVQFREWGTPSAQLAGIDLDAPHIERAALRLPGADLRVGDARRLPWPDASFDIVVQSTVFTFILSDDMRRAVAREMVRVLRPGGVVLWYDFTYDNPRNSNVRGIGVREIRSLFPDMAMTCTRVTLAPPLARLIVPRSELAANVLNAFPFLRTHLVATLRK